MTKPKAAVNYRTLLNQCRAKINPGAPIVSRYAPSPTGHLHLGHLANACFVWGITHALGGKVILRMEDHDRGRCRPEYEQSILDDLTWLGLAPDEGALDSWGQQPHPYRQSDCSAHYESALHLLQKQHCIYACDCSRKQLQDRLPFSTSDLIYDGHCAERKLPLDQPDTAIRFRIDPSPIQFEDLLLGRQQQNPKEQCGDFPLKDRHGCWTYHFAVVVDDLRQGVNLIIRGEDLLDSTGRQWQLAQALGCERLPLTLHHHLITDDSGRKLSKRDKDTSIQELRAVGHSPETVLGRAAFQCGLTGSELPLQADDLATLFLSE